MSAISISIEYLFNRALGRLSCVSEMRLLERSRIRIASNEENESNLYLCNFVNLYL
jgi:hypothetical protein